jgi:hypothetical protein
MCLIITCHIGHTRRNYATWMIEDDNALSTSLFLKPGALPRQTPLEIKSATMLAIVNQLKIFTYILQKTQHPSSPL